MKTIIVFLYGEVHKYISYRTKTAAKLQIKYFQRFGMADYMTGLTITGATFELI